MHKVFFVTARGNLRSWLPAIDPCPRERRIFPRLTLNNRGRRRHVVRLRLMERMSRKAHPSTAQDVWSWPPRLLANSPMIVRPRPCRMDSGADPLSETPHFTTLPTRINSTRNSGSLLSNCACRATMVSSSDTISPSLHQRSPSSCGSSAENMTRISSRSSRYFAME